MNEALAYSMSGKEENVAKDNRTKLLAGIFTVGFILNLIWENAQAPLYKGFTDFQTHLIICFWASLLDAAIVLLLAFIVSFWREDSDWITCMKWDGAVVLMIFGGILAGIFEVLALEFEVWEYSSKMPLVPFFFVGLTPLLQMIILPPLTIYLTGTVFRNKI